MRAVSRSISILSVLAFATGVGSVSPAHAMRITTSWTCCGNLEAGNAFVLWGSTSGGVGVAATATNLGTVIVGHGLGETVVVGANSQQPSGAANVYSVVGNLGPVTSPVITLGLESVDATNVIVNHTTFEQEFPGFTALQIGTAILNNDTATLRSFFLSPEVLPR